MGINFADILMPRSENGTNRTKVPLQNIGGKTLTGTRTKRTEQNCKPSDQLFRNRSSLCYPDLTT